MISKVKIIKKILHTIPDSVLVTSFPKGKIVMFNSAFCKLTGYSPSYLRKNNIDKICFFRFKNKRKEIDEILNEKGKVFNINFEIVNRNKKIIDCMCSSKIIILNRKKYVVSIIKNVTKQKEIERKLLESEERHRLLADNVNDIIWTTDTDGNLTYVSPSIEKITGFSPSEIIDNPKKDLICPESYDCIFEAINKSIVNVGNNLKFIDFRSDLMIKNIVGETIWTDTTVSGMYNKAGEFKGIVGVSKDINERKLMEERMRHISITDCLTGLYNRAKIDEILKEEIQKKLSIIVLDIDYFKKINDKYGHHMGDLVLEEFAGILRKNVTEDCHIGRWGGEEFLIILPDKDIQEAAKQAEKLRDAISAHEFLGLRFLTASFGVASTDYATNEIELITKADEALYSAKRKGRNRVVVA